MTIHARSFLIPIAIGLTACSSSSRAPVVFSPDDSSSPIDGASDGLADSSDDVRSEAGDGASDAGDAADGTLGDGASDAPSHDSATKIDTGTIVTPLDGTVDPDTSVVVPEVGVGDADLGTPPICDPSATYATTSSLSALSSADDDFLAGVTPDELTIAWTVVDALGGVKVFTADRASTATPFDAARAVTIPAGGVSIAHGVALSPDGLRLLMINSAGNSLREIVRSSRTTDFSGSASAAPYALINGTLGDGGYLAAYVTFGADDRSLYLTYGDPTTSASVRVSTRSAAGTTWSGLALVPGSALSGKGLLGVAPTGASADGRTLFLWSPAGAREYAAYRAAGSASFDALVDLADRRYAAPSADCKRVYYSALTAGTGYDLATAQ
jgi:hypothetical protein